MSVESILFEEKIQKLFLSDIICALKEIKEDETPSKNVLLFGETKSFAVDDPPDRVARNIVHMTSIANIVSQAEGVCTDTVTPKGLKVGVDFLQWIVDTPNINPILTTWAVLIVLYLSDAAKDIVCSGTASHIAYAYLSDYDNRFETYLCGELKHSKSHKRSELVRQSKSPTEIVLCEWLFVKQLYTGLANQINQHDGK